jgi:hypothetical protein
MSKPFRTQGNPVRLSCQSGSVVDCTGKVGAMNLPAHVENGAVFIGVRGNRGLHFDLAVRALAPAIHELQSAGIRDIREMAKYLNERGVLAPSGRPFSYGTTRRILVRLNQLHLGLGPRTLKTSKRMTPRPYKFRPRKSRRPKSWPAPPKAAVEEPVE